MANICLIANGKNKKNIHCNCYFFKTGANNSLSLQVFALLERLNVKCALEDLDPVIWTRNRETVINCLYFTRTRIRNWKWSKISFAKTQAILNHDLLDMGSDKSERDHKRIKNGLTKNL
ncbi:hypothetical protein C2G38_2142971 [Gigaspora rosea]|uniref:Uncharacterized protein n=1 Tax=Gigaspora rosea TaxID=44941 RepID=A0A397V9L8_9GLOM|nr:hypothetical protein C2G38_2142971 [Gigaspora rosea]